MSTGIRIGELCALQWKDIDFDKRILTVKKTMQRIQCNNNTSRTKLIISDPKSESSKRRILILDCMMSFLIEFRKNDNDFILSAAEKPIEPRTMQCRFSKILKNANLPSVHFVSAHLSCHPKVNVFCQGRDSILSTELEKQTDTPSTEVSISI